MFLLLGVFVCLFLRKVSVNYVIFLFIYPKEKKLPAEICFCNVSSGRSTFRPPKPENAHLTDEEWSWPQGGLDSSVDGLLAPFPFCVTLKIVWKAL